MTDGQDLAPRVGVARRIARLVIWVLEETRPTPFFDAEELLRAQTMSPVAFGGRWAFWLARNVFVYGVSWRIVRAMWNPALRTHLLEWGWVGRVSIAIAACAAFGFVAGLGARRMLLRKAKQPPAYAD